MEMQSASIPVNAKGQGYLVTFAKGDGLNILKSFFLESTRLIKIIFLINLYWMGD